jgi:hypothetical protein
MASLALNGGKAVAGEYLKKILDKIIPVPGLGIAAAAVSILDSTLEEHEREKLEYLRTKEEKCGSPSVMDIGTVHSAVEGLSGPISMEAVLLVSKKKVSAWKAPNGLWVFHKNANYRPYYRLSGAKIYRPTGQKLKDGTWSVSEVPI